MQRLLVEGKNDIHVIANLAIARNLSPILGYESRRKFEEEFTVVAGSKAELLRQLPLVLRELDLENLGIVVDADQKEAVNTWLAVRKVLEEEGYTNLDKNLTRDGSIIIRQDLPTVGIWIMPDNKSKGYLEHFVANLIPEEDDLNPIVRATIQNLFDQELNRFGEIHRQKAEIHTWLAWQANPGLPMGIAMNAKYFDAQTDLANRFIEWLGNVFNFAV